MPRFPWQVDLPNLAQVYAGAAQLKNAQLAIQEREQRLDAGLKKAEAFKAYQEGDPVPLQLVAPETWARMEAGKQAKAKAQMEAADRQQKIASSRAMVAGNVGKAMLRDPSAYQAARGYMAQSGLFKPEELPPADFDPQQAKMFAQQLISQGQAAGMQVQEEKSAGLVDSVEKAAYRNFRAAHPGVTPEQAFNSPDWQTFIDDAKKEALAGKKAMASQVNLTVGGKQQLEKSAKGKLQTKLIDDEEMLEDLKLLQSMNPEEYMGATGRIKSKVLGVLDYFVDLSPDNQEYLSRGRQILETTEQIFNMYRKYITGAAAAEKELARLQQSMINKDLSPTVFKASMERLYGKITRGMRISRRALREGLDVNQISPLDQGKDVDADIKPRLKDLLGQAPDKQRIEAAAQQMVNEGYWDQEYADDWALRGTAGMGAGQ